MCGIGARSGIPSLVWISALVSEIIYDSGGMGVCSQTGRGIMFDVTRVSQNEWSGYKMYLADLCASAVLARTF